MTLLSVSTPVSSSPNPKVPPTYPHIHPHPHPKSKSKTPAEQFVSQMSATEEQSEIAS